jgi:hypothetical protein
MYKEVEIEKKKNGVTSLRAIFSQQSLNKIESNFAHLRDLNNLHLFPPLLAKIGKVHFHDMSVKHYFFIFIQNNLS